VQRIHCAALETLEDVGVQFEDPTACASLEEAGARLDGDRVRIPEGLVRDVLVRVPDEVVLGAKRAEASLRLGEHRFLTTNGFGTTQILDPIEGTKRTAKAPDLAALTRLANALDEVSYCQHLTTPDDLPQNLLDVALAYIVLGNTAKHAHLSMYSASYADEVIEMARIAGDHLPSGSPPVVSLGCCSVSPLRFPAEATILMRRAVSERIPFLVVSGAVTGVMAPVTKAGALVVQTAEHLAALTLAQVMAPGTPIAFGSFTGPMDPRDGRQRLGAAELSLINGATAALCVYYRVPFGYGTGGVTDSTRIGVQAGIEKGLTTMCCALAGVEVIHDAASGILDAGKAVSYEQMVIDAEICRIVRHYLKGIDITDAAMALDVIAEVGPGGSYLTSPHTAQNFRQEILLSEIWREDGEGELEPAVANARRRVDDILSGEAEPILSAAQLEGMAKVWTGVGLDETLANELVPKGA
jgi:trimethylamine--corrinoid protein Co-methyltransferase